MPDKTRLDLEPVSRKACLVGYTGTAQQYRLYDPVSGRIIISTQPRFLEGRRLRWKWSTKTPAQELDSESGDSSDDELLEENRPVEVPRVPDAPELPLVAGRETRTPDQRDDSEPSYEAQLGRGLRKRRPRRFFDGDKAWCADAQEEGIRLPKSYDEAISDP